MPIAKSNHKLRRDKQEGRHWSCKEKKKLKQDFYDFRTDSEGNKLKEKNNK